MRTITAVTWTDDRVRCHSPAMHRPQRALRRAASAGTVALLAPPWAVPRSPRTRLRQGGRSSAETCAKGSLSTRTAGKLTIATDEPAYEPWFKDDKPANGKGFESAVAYAVAKQLGYADGDVVWQSVPFNKAFAPGAKTFDPSALQTSVRIGAGRGYQRA